MTRNTRPILSILAVLALLLVPGSAMAEAMPAGLTLIESGSDHIVATYGSPFAELTLDMRLADGQIVSSIHDAGRASTTTFSVPALDGTELLARYHGQIDGVVAELLADPAVRQTFRDASFRVVWTYVQMAEELTLRLSASDVPVTMLAALRVHPNVIGRAFEEASMDGTGGRAPEKVPGIFSGSNNCNGACGPGCDWCVGIPFTNSYACETNLFCIAHDAYCGAWEDFFNCDFGSCDIL